MSFHMTFTMLHLYTISDGLTNGTQEFMVIVKRGRDVEGTKVCWPCCTSSVCGSLLTNSDTKTFMLFLKLNNLCVSQCLSQKWTCFIILMLLLLLQSSLLLLFVWQPLVSKNIFIIIFIYIKICYTFVKFYLCVQNFIYFSRGLITYNTFSYFGHFRL